MQYIPYTYRIYHKPTKKYYYGSKTSNLKYNIANPSIFWKDGGYFTSSKLVKPCLSGLDTQAQNADRDL